MNLKQFKAFVNTLPDESDVVVLTDEFDTFQITDVSYSLEKQDLTLFCVESKNDSSQA